MNLDHNFFQASKLSEGSKKRKVFTKIGRLFFSRIQERTKKRSSPKLEDFFSSNSSEKQRADAGQSQIIGGDTVVDHTQIIGEDTVKLLGGIYPPISTGFGTPVYSIF